MATQYHFLVCCKKIAETEWTLEMQADSGEVPMSIVHPDSETDRVLTANPITQTIAEARIMTQYLRQLNRYSGSGAIGHNDSVIRSISQRLSQLQLGQQITVKISCFKYKGLRSGLYEINSLGVFPPVKHTRSQMVPPSQEQKARAPQAFVDAIASLGNHVEILQQELHAAQRVLHEYGLQLKAQEKQIQRLAVKNNQLNETPNSKTKPTQKSKRHLRKAAESQSSSSTQEADSDHIETEAQSLLEQKPQQKQIQQLAVENNQLNETPTSKTKPTQKSERPPQKAAESQSSSSTQEADSDHIETEAQSLLEQKPQQKQIQQLAVENNQLNETPTSKTKPTQKSKRPPQKAAASQPIPSVDEADKDYTDIEAQSLFQQFIKSSKFSKPQHKPSANYPPKGRSKGN